MTQEIQQEWSRHRSNFSFVWLSSMTARKKVARPGSVENTQLRETILALEMADKVRQAIVKDIHLIEAALVTEQVVASIDDTARGHLQQITDPVGSLKSVIWVNPAKADEHVVEWLREGAKPETERRLGFTP